MRCQKRQGVTVGLGIRGLNNMSEARELLRCVINECGNDRNMFHISNQLYCDILDHLETPIPNNHQVQLEPYDAGLLGNGGGGNVEWWHDYIRAELDRAHDFYQDQAGLAYPPERKPLSDDEILEIAKNLNIEKSGLRSFTRAIEKAHGIG